MASVAPLGGVLLQFLLPDGSQDYPFIVPYQAGAARVVAVDQQLRDRDEFLGEIRERLLHAQDVMKSLQDQRRRDITFAVGDWVWLRLHRRTASGITAMSFQVGSTLLRAIPGVPADWHGVLPAHASGQSSDT